MPENDFNSRLLKLRDQFDLLYVLLFPDIKKRPVSGIGWCEENSVRSIQDGVWRMSNGYVMTNNEWRDWIDGDLSLPERIHR